MQTIDTSLVAVSYGSTTRHCVDHATDLERLAADSLREAEPMMMAHTGNARWLWWQEVRRRKSAEEVGHDMGLLRGLGLACWICE